MVARPRSLSAKAGGKASDPRPSDKAKGWNDELYSIFGFDEESGAPLRIGLFFAVVSVLLRLTIIYSLKYLVTTEWSRRACSSVSEGEGRLEDCVPKCLVLGAVGGVDPCTGLQCVNVAVAAVCCCMLVFDVYIVAWLPVTNQKRLKWMGRRNNFKRAFLICEALSCLIFISLLLLSIFVSLGFQENSAAGTTMPPYTSGLDSQLRVSCLSMISVFVYMFIDWCSVCDLP